MAEDNWAYVCQGRLRNIDRWHRFGPPCPVSQQDYTTESFLFNAVREHSNEPTHVIAFDGKSWMVGYYAQPEHFLDNAKYPPEKFSRVDQDNGRLSDFLHGYQSQTADFPVQIPALDRQIVARLHEENVIPIWNLPQYKWQESNRQITSFEPLINPINITDFLPNEAIDELKQVSAEGKPIAMMYDPANKTYSRLEKFEKKIGSKAQGNTTSSSNTGIPFPPGQTSNDNHYTPGSRGSSSDNNKKDIPIGKIAIAGGSVALVAVIGYWVWNMMHRKNQAKQQAAEPHR